MAGVEVGTAYVSIVPSARGFRGKLESQIGGDVTAAGSSSGKKFGGGLLAKAGGVLKAGLKTVGLAGGAVLGAALFKGFNRLNSIEQARAKLEGLGNSTKTVDAIMKNALASVKGTAFGMDEAATSAAGAVASGVKPGKDLERTLKLVADAATIGGTSMGEMGAIFNKVAASGKIQGDVIAQLGDRGIPILQLLGKELHKTPAEVAALASKGKVGFDAFRNAMEKGLGGAALKSGETTQGAFKNMGAALSRFGASLLSGVFPIAKRVFGGITNLLDSAQKAVGPFVDKISTGLGVFFDALSGRSEVGEFEGSLRTINDVGANLYDWFLRMKPVIADVAKRLFDTGKVIAGDVVSAVKNLAATFGPLLGQFGGAALSGAPGTFDKILTAVKALGAALVKVTKFMSDHATLVNTVVVAVLAGVAAYKTIRGAMLLWTAATKAYAAAQALMNAVMSANPIMLVVVAIAALTAGLIYAYKNSATFRSIVNQAFQTIKAGALDLARVAVMAFRSMVSMFLTVVSTLVTGAAKAFGWVPGLGPKLKAAAANVSKFKDDANAALAKVERDLEIKANTAKAAASLEALRRSAGKPVTMEVFLKTNYTGGRVNVAGVGTVNAGQRAHGGPVKAGTPYVVGERRPELFVPETNGRIIPRVPDGGGPKVDQHFYGITDAQEAAAASVNRLTFALAVPR